MIPQTCKNTKLFTRMAEWIYTIINNILISLMRSVIYRGGAVVTGINPPLVCTTHEWVVL